MRLVVFFILAVAACSFASAATIMANGPADGVTLGPDDIRFSFTVDSYTVIKECKLVINEEVVKRLQYKRLIPSSILWSYPLDEGTHEWQVECTTEDDDVWRTTTRTIYVEISKEAEVYSIPSGTVDGSLRYEFDFQNTADQQPALIEDIVPGDFVQISLYVPPSKTKKDFFARRLLTDPSKGAYLVLNHKNENYNVYTTSNTTLPVGSSNVYALLSNVRGVKADLTFYPYYTIIENEEVEEEIEEEEPPEEQETEEEPEEMPEPEVKEEPEEDPETPPSPVVEPRQNPLQKLLSWLVGIFGR